eukprot:CAMPEP_0119015462 /NCGR_PEP_ID=MMETSP1176-20130426/11072_1 /TAXON_ID=265551 /ORGANISM="Synedropsis recta cf, Strain CCMP1620" /LENGTH=181 /DNA_ID=CAMNT_0006968757 /DNA_START=20 /DNA_END=565 /DNA_ORIENTATION=+
MDDDEIETAEGQGADGIASLMKGLESALDDTDEALAETILDACLRMLSSSTVVASLGPYVSTTLSKTLRIMMEEAVVIEVLLAILTKTIKSTKSQNAFAGSSSDDNIKQLLVAMDTHAVGEETVIEYACLVIEKLAEDNEVVGTKLSDAGVEARLTAAESIITNVRNKKYVDQARDALLYV